MLIHIPFWKYYLLLIILLIINNIIIETFLFSTYLFYINSAESFPIHGLNYLAKLIYPLINSLLNVFLSVSGWVRFLWTYPMCLANDSSVFLSA